MYVGVGVCTPYACMYVPPLLCFTLLLFCLIYQNDEGESKSHVTYIRVHCSEFFPRNIRVFKFGTMHTYVCMYVCMYYIYMYVPPLLCFTLLLFCLIYQNDEGKVKVMSVKR
jgi:hypothetical protein